MLEPSLHMQVTKLINIKRAVCTHEANKTSSQNKCSLTSLNYAGVYQQVKKFKP